MGATTMNIEEFLTKETIKELRIMYSHYLDESLTAALSAVRKSGQSYIPTNKDVIGDAPGYDQLY